MSARAISPKDLAAAFLLVLSLSAMGLGLSLGPPSYETRNFQWILLAPLIAASAAAPFLTARLPKKPTIRQLLLLAVPFLIFMRFLDVGDGKSLAGLNVPYWIAVYFEAVAVAKLYSPPHRGREPGILLGSGAGIATVGAEFSGLHDAQGHRPEGFWIYPAIVLAFSFPAVVVARGALGTRSGKKTHLIRLAALGLAFALTIGVALAGSLTFEQSFDAVSERVIRTSRNFAATGGFTGQAKIGDIASLQGRDGGSEVAIRAFSAKMPGYLRGRTFADYKDREWTLPTPREERTTREPGAPVARYVLPGRSAPREGRAADASIHPSTSYQLHYFFPLETCAIETPYDHLIWRPGGALTSPYEPTSVGYEVFLDGAPAGPAQRGEPDYLALPQDPAIVETLDLVVSRLSRRDGSLDEAARALGRYFEDRYAYRIGISFAPSPDPVVQFLREKDHGHCELFATCGVLLLRRMGFRARYTTGFLCEERDGEDLWLARSKHAHAWIEADSGAGWRTIELTPPSGMPSTEPATGLDAVIEKLKAEFERASAALARKGVAGFVRDLAASLWAWLRESPARLAVPLVVLALGATRLVLRRRASRPRPAAPRIFPPEVAAERDAFLRLEKELSRRGLGRGGAETLLEYASRLEKASFEGREEAVALVRGYSERRYARF